MDGKYKYKRHRHAVRVLCVRRREDDLQSCTCQEWVGPQVGNTALKTNQDFFFFSSLLITLTLAPAKRRCDAWPYPASLSAANIAQVPGC